MANEFDRTAYVTTTEASRSLGVTSQTIRRWIDAGYVRAVRTAGGRLLVERDSLADAVPRPVRTAPETALSASQSGERRSEHPVRPCALDDPHPGHVRTNGKWCPGVEDFED